MGGVAEQQQQQGDVGGVGLGKGAWDCDANKLIPPEKEAEVFEELPTMEYAFEGIATVPPRKDMDHMAFYCGGCRYRLRCSPDWEVPRVKEALFGGGITRQNREGSHTPGIRSWEDIELVYAGQVMDNGRALRDYRVPPGCKALIAVEGAKLRSGKPDPDSAYWC